MSAPAILRCALTGPTATKDDNPYLPTTPEEIAQSAREAHAAGAAVVHIHLRDQDERPTADLEIARLAVDVATRLGLTSSPPSSAEE